MIKEKIRNIHYLEMYSKIKDNFNSAVEYSDNDNIYGFIYLKTVIEEICDKLISIDDLKSIYNSNQSCKDNIAMLEFKGILDYDQVTLFNSILDMADKYANRLESIGKRKEDLESLRNFCVRLDKQLPSIMSHLGIGGSSRSKYINKNKFKRRTDIVKANVNPLAKQNKSLSEILANKKRNKKIIVSCIVSIIVIAVLYLTVWIKNNNINVVEVITDNSINLINDIIPDKKINIINKIQNSAFAAGINGEGHLKFQEIDDGVLYKDEKLYIFLENGQLITHDLKTNIRHSFYIESSKSNGLSNGEVVSLTIPQEFNDSIKSYNLSLSSNSINITISNLLDVDAILEDKKSVVKTIEDYAKYLGESNTNESLKWTGTAEKIYLIPSSSSNKHTVVAYLCLKKTFYNWIVGIYQYQYFIDKYVFDATYTDQLNISLNNNNVSELSNWSSEYNYSKISEDFNIFYKDMDPIVLK